MNLTETAMVAVVTLGVTGSAIFVMSPARVSQRVEVTADQASCRAVELGVLAYVEQRGVPPLVPADIQPYVRGDITAYRLHGGTVMGPGCANPRR